MADVEMKPVDEKKEEKTVEEEKKPIPLTPTAEIKANIALIERAVATLEPRFTHRVLRSLNHLRKRLDDKILRDAINESYVPGEWPIHEVRVCPREHHSQRACADAASRKALLAWLPEPSAEQSMDVDSQPSKQPQAEPVPEVEVYFRLLILHHLLTSPSTYPKALKLAHDTIEKMQALNRRSMDPIAAKVWYAVERVYELSGDLADARP